MKKQVYLVRHAKPNLNTKTNERSLCEKGLNDSKKVANILCEYKVDAIYCSPFLRSIQTLDDFSSKSGLSINIIDDFRERLVSKSRDWLPQDEFIEYFKKQWKDLEYRYSDGESIKDTQDRNVKALKECLKEHSNIVIGTHGQAMSSIINYYDKNFIFDDFSKISMPDIYVLTFDGDKYLGYKRIYDSNN